MKAKRVEYFLATYSPQLNLIELLWQKLQYENWDALVSFVEDILRQVGTKYTINFVSVLICQDSLPPK